MFSVRITCLVFAIYALCWTARAQNIAAIDDILIDYQGENPGAALLVIKDGTVVLQRNYGYADLERRIQVKPETNFRLASVTKQFTATCVLQLIHAGNLSLTTPLTEIFSGFPDYGSAITIRHLLTHTSGIPDYEDYVADTALNPQIRDQAVLDILMKCDSGYFTPGSQFRYSNSGYALLALVVEKYSGQSFDAYLRQHIFEPLGMEATLAYIDGKNTVTDRAYGYSRMDNRWERRDQSSTSAVLGDGGIYANVLDLSKWDQALYTDRILPSHLIEEAFAYSQLINGDTVKYGYGWHLKQNSSGEQVVYHTGSSTSFRNILYRIPSKRFCMILLTNRDQPQEEDMLTLAEEIVAKVL
jgi:Beta-lactamase class C and other penicillin binding proteins